MLCAAYHVCRKQSLQLCGRLRTKHHAFLVQEKVVIVTHCKLLPIVSVKIYINGNIPTSKMIKGALWSNGEELLINEWSKYECLFLKGQVWIVNATISAPSEDEIYFDHTVRQIKIILIATTSTMVCTCDLKSRLTRLLMCDKMVCVNRAYESSAAENDNFENPLSVIWIDLNSTISCQKSRPIYIYIEN